MTWPNVLVLQYLRQSGQTNPEIELKARLNISLGYQRMLTFQHPDTGGFSWYGHDEEHLVLTAYGLMELTDMAQVHPVDETVLDGAAGFLALHQEADGHWEPPTDRPFRTGGSVSQDAYQATTFIAWALHHSGRQEDAVQQALAYLATHVSEATSTFAKALLAAFLAEAADANPGLLAQLLDELADLGEPVEDGGLVWQSNGGGSLYNYGVAADIETTALAALALASDPQYATQVQKAVAFLVSRKDRNGNFETTQATVFALKALLSGIRGSCDGTLSVNLNGEQTADVVITQDDSDVFRVVDLKNLLSGDAHTVELHWAGEGSVSFQVVGLWYVPWSELPDPPPGPLELEVVYDKTNLRVNDTITVQVTARNTTTSFLPMVILDLGTPPGFDPLVDDLDRLVSDGTIAGHEETDRQVIVYTRGLDGLQELSFSYRIQATMPFSGEGSGHRAYVYYTPEVEAVQPPIAVHVAP